MLFWTLVTAMALLCAAILVRAALRGRPGAEPAAAYDLRVYRDQLKEVDRDLARGVIGAEDAERVRAEVSRRILAADAKLRAASDSAGQPRAAGLALAGLAVALVGAGAVVLYAQIGAPGLQDLPLKARIAASDAARANRLSQAEAEARAPVPAPPPEVPEDYMQLMEKLRQTVAKRPDDLRGLTLLVRNEAALGNLGAASAAQQHIIELKGPEATAEDYALLTDLMVAAAGGYVSRDAEAAIRAALQRDPEEPRARYYMGLYLLQVDRPDGAFRAWERLLSESPPEAPWVPIIRSQIEELAWRAGVKYELPPLPQASDTGPGPSAEDIDAARQMSAEDRQQMIRAMVARLAGRLQAEGGPAQDWARLIGAYGVLGETESARETWQKAQEAFAGREAELTQVRQAARDAGVVEE